MPGGFNQYGGLAGGIADSYGLDRSVFFGLIETESGWNPNADAPGSSAFGFTQLLAGTAKQLGVNRFDPTQNLKGGASYLSTQIKKFGLVRGLAAYHDGPGAIGLHGGYAYAKTVLSKAKKYLGTGNSLLNNAAVQAGLNAAVPGSGVVAGMLGGVLGGEDSCGLNPICYLQQWIDSSKFFQRLGLAILAFIILAAAFYLMNRTEINGAIGKAALAA